MNNSLIVSSLAASNCLTVIGRGTFQACRCVRILPKSITLEGLDFSQSVWPCVEAPDLSLVLLRRKGGPGELLSGQRQEVMRHIQVGQAVQSNALVTKTLQDLLTRCPRRRPPSPPQKSSRSLGIFKEQDHRHCDDQENSRVHRTGFFLREMKLALGLDVQTNAKGGSSSIEDSWTWRCCGSPATSRRRRG